MALQKEANSAFKSALLFILNKFGRKAEFFFTKKGIGKFIKEIKPYRQSSIKKLIKKNKNHGIYILYKTIKESKKFFQRL